MKSIPDRVSLLDTWYRSFFTVKRISVPFLSQPCGDNAAKVFFPKFVLTRITS